MERQEELLNAVKSSGKGNEAQVRQLIDEIVFIEGQLVELKKYPFIAVHPRNPKKQKATPAAKQCKEMLQQYNNSLRILLRVCGGMDEAEGESPLRKWVREKNIQE